MVLIKKLSKVGNSWGVILSNEVLQMAGMGPKTECEIYVDKNGIRLRPHHKKKKAAAKSKDDQVAQAMSRFLKKYREDLKKLA